MIVRRQQGHHEPAHGMVPDIRRDISDSQPPIRIAVVLMRANLRDKGPGMTLRPLAMLGKNFRRRRARAKIEPVNQVAVDNRIIRCKLNGPPEVLQRIVHLPIFRLRAPQVAVRNVVIRLKPDRLPEFPLGPFAVPHVRQRIAEHISRLGAVRHKLNRRPQRLGRLFKLPYFKQGMPKVKMGLGKPGLGADGPLKRRRGLCPLPLVGQGFAKVVKSPREILLKLDGPAIGFYRQIEPALVHAHVSEIEIDLRLAGLQLDRALVRISGSGEISLGPQRIS